MNKTKDEFRTHSQPVWRTRADFIAHGRIHGIKDDVRTYEQIWTHRLGENRFEVCCIPYFLYDLNLGDHIELSPDGDMEYVLKRVVHDAGHSTFRFYCLKGNAEVDLQSIFTELEKLGCLIEHEGNGYAAVDAATKDLAETVLGFLDDLQARNLVRFETGRQ